MPNERISIQKCREIWGEKYKDLPDEEIVKMRDHLYFIAELKVEIMLKDIKEGKNTYLEPE